MVSPFFKFIHTEGTSDDTTGEGASAELYKKIATVDAALEKCGGSLFGASTYWSSHSNAPKK